MPYLTYDEYNDLGLSEIEETEFNKLVLIAGDVLDHVTRNFYQFNSLDDDVEFRRTKFKKAVAAQVQFFHDMGAISSHELNEPSHVLIGRTTMAQNTRSSNSQEETKNNIISNDVYIYLNDTGLLNRSIGVI